MKRDFRGGHQAELNGPGAKKKGEMNRKPQKSYNWQ